MKIFSLRNMAILILIAAAIVYTFFQRSNPLVSLEGKIRVPVGSIEQNNFIIATGSVESHDDVLLAFEKEGVVNRVFYREGDTVKSGSVIAELEAGVLATEIKTQQSRVDRETVQLGSFVDGPESDERVRIRTQVNLAEQEVVSEIQTALVTAQQNAVAVESVVHTELDELFISGSSRNLKFQGDVSVPAKQQINRVREEAEGVFESWREWSNIRSSDHGQVLPILEGFERDVRVLYNQIVEMYDLLVPKRFKDDDTHDSFVLLSKMRERMFDIVAVTVRDMNRIQTALRKYDVTLAQSVESLSGGTLVNTLTQSARVNEELGRLRGLELEHRKTAIRAPFAGTLGEIFIEEGEFAQRGADAIRFVSHDGFNVSVNVTEVEIQNLKIDQKMPAVIVATGEKITVCVRSIDVTESRVNDIPVYTVVFDVIDENVSLRSGMTIDVHIQSAAPALLTTVPIDAVIEEGDEHYVVVYREGDPVLLPVSVGEEQDNGMVVVIGDVYEGDMVVLNRQVYEQ